MVLIFAGAGASKAVNPDRYPTTVEFFERLPDAIKSQDLFRFAVQYLKDQNEEGHILDIEQILWLINELKQFTSVTLQPSSLPGWFLTENRLGTLAKTPIELRKLHQLGINATATIDRLSSEINKLVYELYGEPPSREELQNNWLTLLTGLKNVGLIEIVTTNYDVVIEEAIAKSGISIITGRSSGTQPLLDQTAWDLQNASVEDKEAHGRFTKLHGSVDWVRGNDRIHVGFPFFQGKHEKHVIIYPGFKGVPSEPLFQQLHQYFHMRLSQADVVLFIGYAFRDEYINTILQRDLSQSAKILVLNPAPVPKIPFSKASFKQVSKAFDEEGVKAVLLEIRNFLGQ